MSSARDRFDDAGMDHTTRRLFVVTLLVVTVVAGSLAWLERHSTADAGARVGVVEVGAPRPTVATGLQPGLERAFAGAVDAAGRHGHTLTLTSGFRTASEQERLLVDAVAEHGSRAEALRWVFTPERSMHVRGLAVDVGDASAAEWLDDHGAELGLCRTLSWEWWHFEWRAEWETSRTCPGPVDDPADAPGV